MKIATIYSDETYKRLCPNRMSTIRWLRMSEALAEAGHQVDLIVNCANPPKPAVPRLRFIPWSKVRWDDYDVVKANYQRGFALLEKYGGAGHPFVIARLGSVVAGDDRVGTPFTGQERTLLYELQSCISEQARAVAVLTESEKHLWSQTHGPKSLVAVVPTGVDAVIPQPRLNPYQGISEKIAVFIGNLRGGTRQYPSPNGDHHEITTQAKLNRQWQQRLNSLGRRISKRGVRLCVVGAGAADKLDPASVTYLGPVDHCSIWDYHYFADVGIALCTVAGQIQECSKLYSYMRAGLPAVSERSIPTNDLLHATGMGFVVDDYDEEAMAEMIVEAINRGWDSREAVDYMIRNHTWRHRADTYGPLMDETQAGAVRLGSQP